MTPTCREATKGWAPLRTAASDNPHETLGIPILATGYRSPLVGYHSRSHCSTDHIHDRRVKEEIGGERETPDDPTCLQFRQRAMKLHSRSR